MYKYISQFLMYFTLCADEYKHEEDNIYPVRLMNINDNPFETFDLSLQEAYQFCFSTKFTQSVEVDCIGT
jgi:hypothetical protein